jgi:hypothetical protein
MPRKTARSSCPTAVRAPGMVTAVGTARRSCGKAGKAQIFTPIQDSSGEISVEVCRWLLWTTERHCTWEGDVVPGARWEHHLPAISAILQLEEDHLDGRHIRLQRHYHPEPARGRLREHLQEGARGHKGTARLSDPRADRPVGHMRLKAGNVNSGYAMVVHGLWVRLPVGEAQCSF